MPNSRPDDNLNKFGLAPVMKLNLNIILKSAADCNDQGNENIIQLKSNQVESPPRMHMIPEYGLTKQDHTKQ